MEQDLDKVKKIIAEELDSIIDGYDVCIENINVDMKDAKVHVTFSLHNPEDNDYIGLCFF